MSGERGLRDEFERAIDDPGYYVDHDVLGYNGLEHQTDAVVARVQRHLDAALAKQRAAIEAQIAEHVAMRERLAADAAREQVAEEIAQAIERQRKDRAELGFHAEHVTGMYEAARIARQHAKGVGDE